MANVKFIVKTQKNPSSIYIRFYHSKDFDWTVRTGYIINPKNWSNKQQRITSGLATIMIAKSINPKLIELKEYIINEYNLSYSEGDLIDKNWLENKVLKYNNRPSDELSNNEIYFTPFVEKYINDSKKRVNPSTGKITSQRTIQKYDTTLKRIKEFEEKERINLKIWDINLQFHNKFLSFLKIDCKYGSNTIEKYISQIKTFCREAKTLGYKYNPEFEHRNFTAKREKTIDVYLNKDEIQRIFEHDFSKNETLDNARDLFIIGLWTGLRISDLGRLPQFNITEENIEIINSEKTNISLTIPMHPQVKTILNKRNGNLPNIIADQNFNKHIKKVCEKVEIKEIVMGNKVNPATKRKEKGYYEKHELITSHTCRRSFATNLYGQLPNQTIMAITGHKSEQQFIKYVKITQEEHIEKVREYWNQNN